MLRVFVILVALFAFYKVVVSVLAYRAFGRARIESNSKAATASTQALIEAQVLYEREDRDGDGRHEYAVSLAELARVGLIGPEVAAADVDQPGCKPLQGYVYRVLTAQGPNAPGGEKSWIVDGELRDQNAIAAFPIEYGVTGRFTYIMSSAGTIYQQDLGEVETPIWPIRTFDIPSKWMRGDHDLDGL